MHIQVSTRGRITIPIALRRKLGIKPGTRIRFEVDEQTLRIVANPITPKHVRRVKGMFKGSGAIEMFREEKKKSEG